MAPQDRPAARVIPLAVVAGCLALAALTLLVPSLPTTDPWGWIVWGREVAHLELDTDIGGAPSWKPLPIPFTALFSLAGDAAPTLWMLAARTAGLLGLVMAFRVAAELVGDRAAGARWAAGLLAAVGLVLSLHWMRYFAHGYTEPMAIALLLGAIDRHLAGRPRQALVLGTLVCLARPEAFPLVGLYGLVIWRRKEEKLWFVAAMLALVPLAWLVPDWIGSGNPFHGSEVARQVLTHVPQDLWAAVRITPIPYALAAIAAAALAAWRRDWTFAGLVLAAVGWAGLLRLMIALDYPPSDRFFVLPAAVVCVLGAAGFVRLVLAPPIRWLRPAIAVGLVALVAWSAVPRVQRGVDEARAATRRSETEEELWRAINDAGGEPTLSRCGLLAMPRGFAWLHGVVAWELEGRIETTFRVRGGTTNRKRLTAGANEPVTKGTARVRIPRRRAVLFLPYERMNTRFVAGRGRPEPPQFASSGAWGVYAVTSARCRPTAR